MSSTHTENDTLSAVIGQNLRKRRKDRRLTVTEFARRMHAAIGQGWQPVAVYAVQSGKRQLNATELLIAADILGCAVADLVAHEGQLSIGTRQVDGAELVDTLRKASPEVEGWARFEDATDALNDMRNAAARYEIAMGYVRARVAVSRELGERLRRFGKQARESLGEQVSERKRIDEADNDHAQMLLDEALRFQSEGDEAPQLSRQRVKVARDTLQHRTEHPHLYIFERTPAYQAATDALNDDSLEALRAAWFVRREASKEAKQ